ncbi:hypothetical protein Hanom_Chr14g01308591 [Helianthus anomalus]
MIMVSKVAIVYRLPVISNLLDDVKLLFGNGVSANDISSFHNELFLKCSHSFARYINIKILKIRNILCLYTISTYKKLVSNNKRA